MFLGVIGKEIWEIENLKKVLIEKGMKIFISNRVLKHFLRNRPTFFNVTNTHVCRNVNEKTHNPSNFEKKILAVIGKEIWEIEMLKKVLIEKGINNFQTNDTLKGFLKNRSKLFNVKYTCVCSIHYQEEGLHLFCSPGLCSRGFCSWTFVP